MLSQTETMRDQIDNWFSELNLLHTILEKRQ